MKKIDKPLYCPCIGTKAWEKEITKAHKEGKVKYSLPKDNKDGTFTHSENKRIFRAQLFLRSLLTKE